MKFSLIDILTDTEISSITSTGVNPTATKIGNGKAIPYNPDGTVDGISNHTSENSALNTANSYLQGIQQSGIISILSSLGIDVSSISNIINQLIALTQLPLQSINFDSLGGFTNSFNSIADNIARVLGSSKDVNEVKRYVNALSSLALSATKMQDIGIINTAIGTSLGGVPGNILGSIGKYSVGNLFGGLSNGLTFGGYGAQYGDNLQLINRDTLVLLMYNTATKSLYQSVFFGDSFTVSTSADWDRQSIFGRVNPIVAYNSSSMTIDIRIRLHRDYLINDLEECIVCLEDMALPLYAGNRIIKPYIRLSIGSISYLTVCNSCTVTRRNDVIGSNKHLLADVTLSFQIIGKSDGSAISAKVR